MKKTNHQQNVRSIAIKTFQILIILSIVGSAMVGPVAAVPSNPATNWDHDITNYVSGADPKDVVIGPNNVFVSFETSTSGGVIAFDRSDGSHQWTYDSTDVSGGSPSVTEDYSLTLSSNDDLYFGFVNSNNDPEIRELSRSTGSLSDSVVVSTYSYSSAYIYIDSDDPGVHVAYRDSAGGAHEYQDSTLTQSGTADAFSSGLPTGITAYGSDASVITDEDTANGWRIYGYSQSSFTTSYYLDEGSEAPEAIDSYSSSNIFISGDSYSGAAVFRTSEGSNIVNPASSDVYYTSNNGRIGLHHPSSNAELFAEGDEVVDTTDMSFKTDISLSGYNILHQTTGLNGEFASLYSSNIIYWSEAKPYFEVSKKSDNSPVPSGQTYQVDVLVENTGSESDTQTITLDIDGTQEDSTSVNLAAGGSTTVTLSWPTDTSDVGGHTATLSSDNDTTSYTVKVKDKITSIDLTINDKTLLPTQSSSYTVTGDYQAGGTVDITDSSNVSSSDSTIVGVDTDNYVVTYQSDGSAIITAEYTNRTGVVLTDKETVETDTPVISLNLEANPVELDPGGVSTPYNYTVTNTTFGTSTNVSLQATVTSDNLTVVTIDEPNLNYVAQSVGIANLTASDGGYSDTVQVEVDPPSELIYENWDYMSSGEKSIVMFSDWTILWLLGSVIVSVLFAKSYQAPRVGIMIFTGLQVIGWVTGFVPGYVVLSIVIVEVFFGFLINFTFSGQNANS